MPHEQDAQLVDAAVDVRLAQAVLGVVALKVRRGKLVQREHRIIARVVRVVHGGPVHTHPVGVADREEVGNGDGFVVGDQKPNKRAGGRRP